MGTTNSKTIEHTPSNAQSVTQNQSHGGTYLGKCPMKISLKSHPDERVTVEQTSSLEKCPVKHTASISSSSNKDDIDRCPMKNNSSVSSNEAESGGCPVKSSSASSITSTALNTMYNVYAQPIDPTNQMPAVANQLPNPGQSTKLSTTRQSSTIPKGGTNSSTTWTYPSPQMFYNSLVRKGKLDPDVCSEEDVETVVHLHNNMNEKTWAKVMQWEGIINSSLSDSASASISKLSRFMGRPMDLSPKAWFKNMFLGHPLPFDRHDWTLVREGGTEVRYIIDYYHDDNAASQDKSSAYPDMHDHNAVKSILVDVRPAVDSMESVFARTILMPYKKYITGESNYETLPMIPSASLKTQVAEADKVWANIQANASASRAKTHSSSDEAVNKATQKKSLSKEDAVNLVKDFDNIMNQCKEAQHKISTCSSEKECSTASLDLTLCMAKIVCPIQHKTVVQSLNSNETNEDIYNTKVETSLENATLCVHQINYKLSSAKKHFPDLFGKN